MADAADPNHNPHRTDTLAVPHSGPLSPRGMLITCAQCEATRDWFLIYVHPDLLFVRCRCSHEWYEVELEAVDLTAARGEHFEQREWSSFEEMYRGLGFDGLLHGTYLG